MRWKKTAGVTILIQGSFLIVEIQARFLFLKLPFQMKAATLRIVQTVAVQKVRPIVYLASILGLFWLYTAENDMNILTDRK